MVIGVAFMDPCQAHGQGQGRVGQTLLNIHDTSSNLCQDEVKVRLGWRGGERKREREIAATFVFFRIRLTAEKTAISHSYTFGIR